MHVACLPLIVVVVVLVVVFVFVAVAVIVLVIVVVGEILGVVVDLAVEWSWTAFLETT